MAFGIPSLGNLASSIGNAVGDVASKAASVVTQQAAPAPAPQAPAAPAKPVDSFDASASKGGAVCGGTDTAGAQCLPSWGKASGGGGGGAGINPSGR